MTVLLGNSGAPRWYFGPDRNLETYLDYVIQHGATSSEIVLHHGPYDERTARVHVLDPDWARTVDAYQRRGLAVQLHVSLDLRFATSRWWDDREGLIREYEPILATAATIAEQQNSVAVVLHGAADTSRDLEQNEGSTTGLLDWLASRIQKGSMPVRAALELGAAKPGRESAAARSRASAVRIVRRVASPDVGICWDLAHDRENARTEDDWSIVPDVDFLRSVVHVHLHDLDDQGMAHYPLLLGSVPYTPQLRAIHDLASLPSITMEVRWICASRLGDPWQVLGNSYATVLRKLEDAGLSDR